MVIITSKVNNLYGQYNGCYSYICYIIDIIVVVMSQIRNLDTGSGTRRGTERERGRPRDAAGLQRVSISINLQETDELQLSEMRPALVAEGMTLTPLKCNAAREGASYGNLVFIAKVPKKTPSGLHENWDCSMNGCGWSMTILYRKADVTPIECATS